MNEWAEKRQTPRRSYKTSAILYTKSHAFSAQVLNVSEGGLAVEMRTTLSPEEKVQVEFLSPLSQQLVVVEGNVRYVSQVSQNLLAGKQEHFVWVGIQIFNLSSLLQEEIRQYTHSPFQVGGRISV